MSQNEFPPSESQAGSADDLARKQALTRLHAQQTFKRYLVTWAGVSVMMIVIWLLSGGLQKGLWDFWPIWVIAAMGIGALWAGISAYGPRDGAPSEAKIQEEIRKMQQ